MHKKHSTSSLKIMLSDVLCIAFEHMQALAMELRKLDINESNVKEKSKSDLDRAQLLSHVLTLINDVIHPVHDTALTLFPDAKDFVEYCIKNQALAVEKKLISPNCNCYVCKMKVPGAKA
jgi:hypothetical protein